MAFAQLPAGAGSDLGTPLSAAAFACQTSNRVRIDMPSTSIREARYDPDRRILSVWFLASGRRYDYVDVPPSVYAAYTAAFSKGRFFNSFIRDRYGYIRRDDERCGSG